LSRANLETSCIVKILRFEGKGIFKCVVVEFDGRTYNLSPGDCLELKANLNWNG